MTSDVSDPVLHTDMASSCLVSVSTNIGIGMFGAGALTLHTDVTSWLASMTHDVGM